MNFVLKRPVKSRDGSNYNLKLGGKLRVVALAKAYGADFYSKYDPAAIWWITDNATKLAVMGSMSLFSTLLL